MISIRYRESPRKKLKVKEVERPELNDCFEFKNIKVVYGEESSPICFSKNYSKEVLEKASNVYFYADFGFSYFNSLFRAAMVTNPSAIPLLENIENTQFVFRIDQSHYFDPHTHFSNESVDSRYEIQTLTIPPSSRESLSWGPETWFFPGRNQKKENVVHRVFHLFNSQSTRSGLRNSLLFQDAVSVSRSIQAQEFNQMWDLHVESILLSLGLSELLPRVLDWATKPFKQTYFCESAFIPEAIVHEIGHLVLMPIFGAKTPTQLNEGFPNYFAAKAMGLKKIGAKTGSASRGYVARDGTTRRPLDLKELFSPSSAFGSFTFSLLMELDQNLPSGMAERILLRSLTESGLNGSSQLTDLDSAVRLAIRTSPEIRTEERGYWTDRINLILNQRNLK